MGWTRSGWAVTLALGRMNSFMGWDSPTVCVCSQCHTQILVLNIPLSLMFVQPQPYVKASGRPFLVWNLWIKTVGMPPSLQIQERLCPVWPEKSSAEQHQCLSHPRFHQSPLLESISPPASPSWKGTSGPAGLEGALKSTHGMSPSAWASSEEKPISNLPPYGLGYRWILESSPALQLQVLIWNDPKRNMHEVWQMQPHHLYMLM